MKPVFPLRAFAGLLLVAFAASSSPAADSAAAAAAAPSVVRVDWFLRFDDGEAPEIGYWKNGDASSYPPQAINASTISEGRPLESWGIVLEDSLVLTEDTMIEDRFIDRVEVEAGGKRYAAGIDRAALDNVGIFLRTGAPLEGVAPLAFEPDAAGPYSAVTFQLDRFATWVLDASPFSFDKALTRDGARIAQVSAPAGIVMNDEGKAIGVSMRTRHASDGDWRGSPLSWPAISRADLDAAVAGIKDAAARGLVGVTVNFRSKQSRRMASYFDSMDQRMTEVQCAGVVYAPGKVIVFADLSRHDVARIEAACMTVGEGTVPLAIEGALRGFTGLLASFDPSTAGVEPVKLASAVPAPQALTVADVLSYESLARDERLSRARVFGIRAGGGNNWLVLGSGSDTFLFSLDGALASLPLARKQPLSMGREGGYDRRWSGDNDHANNMAAVDVAALLADGAAVDAGYRPLSEEDAERVVWLGIEMQALSPELARAKSAALATKGGEVGGLVTYVYKDSPAERTGVKAGDIFVRFLVPGQAQPVDVAGFEERQMNFPWAELDRVPDMYFEQLPRPWPSQNNALNRVLTETGPGGIIKAEFVRDGAAMPLEFTLEMGPRDFGASESYANAALGLTVKNPTHEVRYYFKMDESKPGIVAAEIEAGSKASVAGLKPCEVITAVNGKPVMNVDEFKAAVEPGGDIALTVKRMNQTRVVKVSLPQAAALSPSAESTDAT